MRVLGGLFVLVVMYAAVAGLVWLSRRPGFEWLKLSSGKSWFSGSLPLLGDWVGYFVLLGVLFAVMYWLIL